jgi:inhibitor of cysteine peptidase
MIEIDKSYDEREVDMKVGDVAEVKLAENPTTGYRWVFAAKPEPVCKIADDSFEPAGGAPGAGGTHRWKFEAVSSGTGAVELEYRRPWEKNAAAGQTFKLSIRVR